MPYETDNFIHLPNPDHPETDFRKNNKGSLNIVGTVNFGAGVKGRLGLLLNSGKSAVAVYLFNKDKFSMSTAKEWLKKKKSKSLGRNKDMDMDKSLDFNFIMPLKKHYEGKDGFLYLEYALSTTDPDLENDRMTDNCIDDMIKQAPRLNSFMSHDYSRVIGPITKSWREDNEMWVQVRVKPSLRSSIEEDLETGVRYGGSLGGNFIKGYQEGDIRNIEKVQLLEGSLTPMPMNWATLGSARGISKGVKCPNNICSQILKSANLETLGEVEDTIIKSDGMDSLELIKDISGQLSEVAKAVTLLPGYPEDLDTFIAQDQAELMSLLGSLVVTLKQLITDIVDDSMQPLISNYWELLDKIEENIEEST